MKFAKELDQELVPEWRAKYLDYKAGKKKVKALGRALHKANRSSLPQNSVPGSSSRHRRTSSGLLTSERFDRERERERPASSILSSRRPHSTDQTTHTQTQRVPVSPAAATTRTGAGIHSPSQKPPSSHSRLERQPLHTPGSRFSGPVGSYGSIIASPPNQPSMASDMASLELPDPAIDPPEVESHGKNGKDVRPDSPPLSPGQTAVPPDSAAGEDATIARRDFEQLAGTTPESTGKRKSTLIKRVFTHQDADTEKYTQQQQQQQQQQLTEGSRVEIERRRDEFYAFLDHELDKIESFYQTKEQEASKRLQLLRSQLHIMRDQRIQEVLAGSKKKAAQPNGKIGAKTGATGLAHIGGAFKGRKRFGKNTKALAQMASTPGLPARDSEAVTRRRDFSRRPTSRPEGEAVDEEDDEEDEEEGEDANGTPSATDVSYRTAKRKLKYALQEFYRGLELLKGYAYLNRTAFRKINKKYDKTAQTRPTMRFMSEKVNKAWFVQSEVTDNLMSASEDLYARYFERGNRKLAISKLRRANKKAGDFSSNTFRSGLLLMAGLLFGIQALVYVGRHMDNGDPVLKVRTSYLLQIYGGYFLVVFHFLMFCVVCMIWTKSKINHVFIFEFDARHALEWRQLLEIPSFFFFLLGLFMWLNFFIVNDMYIYWPVVLVGLTLILLFLPARVLYHRSRQWWAYSNWRLALAGLYPVEFRDFFLGDMYCSQTYAMGNIELFFCLYAKHWRDPPQCNSSHSRLLGFFQCLPAVWRAFQCLRRYGDTRNVFPHLMNFGKYIFSVLYYATLSMYRIRLETRFEAPFITFALLNAVYVSVWDLAMDWSLGNAYAKHPLLREVLAFRRVWVYYAAMVLDVVVRFNWIFYAIFARDLQHSAVLSFVISFSEVCRRSVWMVFRVENEHCTNVLLFRASRDTPLPYKLPEEQSPQLPPQPPQQSPQQQQQQQLDPHQQQEEQDEAALQQATSGAPITGDIEQGVQQMPPTPAGASVRSRRASRAAAAAAGISRVGSIVAAAHAQDFERRKRPDTAPGSVRGEPQSAEDSSDDDDDGDGDEDEDQMDGVEDKDEDEDQMGEDGHGRGHGRGYKDGEDESEMATGRISEERI